MNRIYDPTPADAGDPPCALAPEHEPRCAHPAVVTVADRTGATVPGCSHHAARALRGIFLGRVYPLPGHAEAAIAVHREAFGGGW